MNVSISTRAAIGLAAAVSLVAGAGMARAAFVPGASIVNPGLTGNTAFSGWDSLNAGTYPGYGAFPGTGAWPSALNPNVSGSGSAKLNKVANGAGGGPYVASGSIYFGGFSSTVNFFGGTLAVTNAAPVANLANIVFQLQIGEAWTYDLFNHALPVLSFNGGAQNIAATYSAVTEKYDNGTVTMPTGEETVYINTYMLQWDLTGLGAITSYSISFSGVQHAQVYAARVDESDVYARIPGSGSLAFFGVAGLVGARRRR